MMNRAFLLIGLLALVPAVALAQTTLGTLHKGSVTVTFSVEGRAVVISQRGPGSKNDEYQLLRCDAWASRQGHVLMLQSMGADFDHIPSQNGAAFDESNQSSLKSMSWPYNPSEDRVATAIVNAIQNRPASCQ